MRVVQWIIIFELVLGVAGCSMRGFRPPPEPYEEFKKNSGKTSIDEVKKALIECGASPIDYGDPRPATVYNKLSSEERYAPKALRVECMFNKGYHFESGWGGYCSDPNYRPELSICEDIPQRSRNNYYGQ